MRYRLGAHRGGGAGPESKKHCWGQIRPHRRLVQNSWISERRGGCKKPNTAGGSVWRARCRHRKVVQNLYTTTWQSNIVGLFTPERPRTWADEGGGALARWPARAGAFTTLLFVLDGRMCHCWNRGWNARRPDVAGKFARMGAGRLGGLIQLVWSSPLPPATGPCSYSLHIVWWCYIFVQSFTKISFTVRKV